MNQMHDPGDERQNKPNASGSEKTVQNHEASLQFEQAALNTNFSDITMWDQPNIADMYASFTRARWYQLLNAELVKLINPAPTDVVLDLGTGTGSFARQLATHQGNNGHIIGIDNSQVMLRKGLELSGDFKSIEYRHGEAHRIGSPVLVAEEVQHISSANAMHLFKDPVAVLIESYEKLPPGGSFSFSTGFSLAATDFSRYEDVQDSFTKFLRRAKQLARNEGTLEEPSRSEKERRIFGIDGDAFMDQMGTLGFHNIKISNFLTYIPVQSVLDFLALPGVGAAVLPGVSEKKAAQYFTEALKSLDEASLPRNWVLIRGTKP